MTGTTAIRLAFAGVICLASMIFVLIGTADPARAQGGQQAPVPAKKVTLDTIEREITEKKREQEALQGKIATLEKELEDTRTALIANADALRDTESVLSSLEQRIETALDEQAALTENLENDYGNIAGLILALQRMRRIPTDALIVRPGAPLQTAQTALLLQSTLPAIRQRTNRLSTALNRLSELTESLDSDRTEALGVRSALHEKQESMKHLVERREDLYARTRSNFKENSQALNRLSAEAKTLMELIRRLESDQADRKRTGRYVAAAMPRRGAPRLPVAGNVVEDFGAATTIGARALGVTIETQPASIAVAPLGGIVRFTGAFKNYGNIVIVEHDNGYHSLIAGLQQISARADAAVEAGEPIGQLPQASSRGGRPALYYELRRGGQPVDPAVVFADLKS